MVGSQCKKYRSRQATAESSVTQKWFVFVEHTHYLGTAWAYSLSWHSLYFLHHSSPLPQSQSLNPAHKLMAPASAHLFHSQQCWAGMPFTMSHRSASLPSFLLSLLQDICIGCTSLRPIGHDKTQLRTFLGTRRNTLLAGQKPPTV